MFGYSVRVNVRFCSFSVHYPPTAITLLQKIILFVFMKTCCLTLEVGAGE